MEPGFHAARRLIVKIGRHCLSTDQRAAAPRLVDALADDVTALRARGTEC